MNDMQGKHCDYYWSVKKEKNNKYTWKIRGTFGGEVIESSLDNEDEDDKYLDTDVAAMSDAKDAIEDHYR